jgi:hypothetical protein
MPFLEGTVPPPDDVHPNGCFDIELAVDRDERRPQEWVESARTFANRLVNRQTGAVGDPTKLKENPGNRLAIAPLPGESGWGGSICGDVIITPRPDPTDRGGPDRSSGPEPTQRERCRPRDRDCTPQAMVQPDEPGGVVSMGVMTPLLGITSLASLLPLGARLLRRRRGEPGTGGAWDNRERVHRRPGADPGGG